MSANDPKQTSAAERHQKIYRVTRLVTYASHTTVFDPKLTRQSSIFQLSVGSRARGLGSRLRANVLVHMEEVIWIVFGLELPQSLIVGSVGCSHGISYLIARVEVV